MLKVSESVTSDGAVPAANSEDWDHRVRWLEAAPSGTDETSEPRGAADRGTNMTSVNLTPAQIDMIVEAFNAAMNETARFLEDDARDTMADVLRRMGRLREADEIAPSLSESDG